MPQCPSQICAIIARTRHKMILAEIQAAAKRGVKLLEIRLDFLAKPPDFKRLLTNRPCPLIATVRRPQDGGRYGGSEEERLVLLRQAIVAGFDYVDLEGDVAGQIRRFGKTRRIVSYHNMEETPDDLADIYDELCKQDADIVKVATMANTPADNLRLLDLVRKNKKPTVAIGMGDVGAPTRILGARLGTPHTYATLHKERVVAPGVLSLDELQKLYRYESITAETAVFGVVGDPVGHSLSPLIHNQAFQKVGLNAVYVPFHVPRGQLANFVKGFESVPVRGLSVTIPHKEDAAQLADHHDADVTMTAAANTLIKKDDGWHAYNTDAAAALASLEAHLPVDAEGKRSELGKRIVLILGAGGVARAIAFVLQKKGAVVTIANRTQERGQKLASEVGCKVVDWGGRLGVICDTIINCTSVGMHPKMDETPIHGSILKPGMMVFDTIYTPETTMLVREAENRGCHVLTGVDMFVRQAGLQFKLFTGQDPPLDFMEKVIRRTLSPVKVDEE